MNLSILKCNTYNANSTQESAVHADTIYGCPSKLLDLPRAYCVTSLSLNVGTGVGQTDAQLDGV